MTSPGAVPVAATGERRTGSDAETRAFGGELAAALAPGQVVGLEGDLGSGKTCLVQGICAGLGVEEVVNSPTFVLLNVYRGRQGVALLTVYHFDLYRLASSEDLEEIGTEQFLYEPDAISLVEWADRMPQMLPEERWQVRLEHGDDETERRIRWQWLAGESNPRREA